ncbi:MAG: tryptophan 7-halogenase [Bacteroidia bacterium]|nr:tryptophan 7-halogenase [Bacteroidia bacterium]
MNKEEVDVVVIGAGPSGSVASAWLNKQGYKVLVLEKIKFPRFVIGESLLPHCMDHLEAVGFLDAVKKHGFQLKTGAAFYKGDHRTDFLFKDQHSKGWTWTWQVKRADFDHILIKTAEEQGVTVKFECEVKKVECSTDKQLVVYSDVNGNETEVTAKFIIDASGYGRVLPRLFNLEEPVKTPSRSAVFCHIHDNKRTSQAGENIFIHSFNDNKAWIWAIPFSDRTTSVGVVSETELVTDMAANGGEKFIAHIRNFQDLNGRFAEEKLLFEPRLIQGYAVRSKQLFGNGYVLCGNSTEFLDPIFSSGVTLATGSGLMAAKLADRKLKGEEINWQTEYEDILRKGIDVFRSFVLGWYNGDLQTILFSKTIDPNFKRQICSVLAGYVWDETNPIVKKHEAAIKSLAKVIRMMESNPST